MAMLEYLAGEGADLTALDENNFSPVWRAVQHGHAEVLEWLAAKGVAIVQPSALHQACLRGHTAVVELLLHHGADGSKTDSTGALAANTAAECKS